MPPCAVCGMESGYLTRCKKCGERFCEECGDTSEKICLFCGDDETVDWSDDSDDARER